MKENDVKQIVNVTTMNPVQVSAIVGEMSKLSQKLAQLKEGKKRLNRAIYAVQKDYESKQEMLLKLFQSVDVKPEETFKQLELW